MLRADWLALADRYGEPLRSLKPRYETIGTRRNRRYRLIAGPLSSTARAINLCDRLKASNTPCTVSTLTGRDL